MATGNQLPGSGETIHLQQQVARLQALLEATRQVHSTNQENEVLEQVLRILVRELEMAGAAFPSVGLTYGDDPSTLLQAPLAWPLEDREGNRLADLLVATPGGRPLTIYESDFIEGLALQASVALENARSHRRNLEFARVQQDLDAARGIQRSLLPQTLPAIEGYSLGFRSDACYEVGGDYLDIVELPDGSLILAVADVAGKGLASAITSMGFRSAFRAMALSGLPLDELAARMNQHHWAEGEEMRRRYVTAIFLRLQPETGHIEIVNAGHNPGFLVVPGQPHRPFHATGTPLGLLPGMSYSAERCQIPPCARLLFYTDGLTEVFQGEEEFGSSRLLDAFQRCSAQRPDAILDALWDAVEAFAAGEPQADDRTALVLCRGAASKETPA
jgi:serine phosphatase RsbU (regulator of sigma subunit)